jgi:lipopolysaccharide transport system permease protein
MAPASVRGINNMDLNITVYHKDYLISDSLITAWRKTLQAVWRNRWLIWVNFKKDFFSQYKQSGLGMLWSLILPIIPLSVYLFLGYVRVLNVKGGMPFPVYMITGMTFWLLLREGIISGMKAIQKDRGILTQINTPLIVVILSRYGNVCANTLIRLVFLIFILFFYKIIPNPNIILIPFILIPLVSLGLGLGILLGIFNSTNSDIENLSTTFLRYGMFLSSVIFPMPTKGILGAVNNINIFNHLIVGLRDFVVLGQFQYPVHFGASSAICLSIMFLSIKWQHTLQYKVKGLL